MDAAQGFFRYGADAAVEIAGGDQSGLLAGADVVLGHALQHILGVAEHGADLLIYLGGGGAALHDMFGAQQLGQFGQEGGAPLLYDAVYGQTQGGVGGDAGGGVGAAALQPQNKLRDGEGFPLLQRQLEGKLPGDTHARFHGLQGAALFLNIEIFHGLARLGDQGGQVLGVDALTAQADHQHCAKVGVAANTGQGVDGLLKVFAVLAAAVDMGESNCPLHLTGHQFGRVVGTEHRWDDGNVVAHAEGAVRAPIA